MLCRPSSSSIVGGGEGIRTLDLMLAKHVLSQLSYTPARAKGPTVVGLGGLEPPTSRLSGVRSNQLSYRPESTSRRRTIGPACQARRSLRNEKDGCEACESAPMIYKRETEAPTGSSQSLRKEVIQPQVPLRLPCYDLVPVTEPSVGHLLWCRRDFGYFRLP